MPGRAVFCMGPSAISLALPIRNFFCKNSFKAASRPGLLGTARLADGVEGPAEAGFVASAVARTKANAAKINRPTIKPLPIECSIRNSHDTGADRDLPEHQNSPSVLALAGRQR